MVSQICVRQVDENFGNHATLAIVYHVGLHVDFSSMKSSLNL